MHSAHSMYSMHSTAACRAYVGEATPAADEYHSEDFDWEDWRREAEALLAARSAQQQGIVGHAPADTAALQAHDPSFNLKLASLSANGSPSSSAKPQHCQQHQPQQQQKQTQHEETGQQQQQQWQCQRQQETCQQKQHQQDQQQAGDDLSRQQYDKGCWEAFHARDNATARFYKERRYLLLEFPALTVTQPPQHFLEIGCGCGSSLLPVLKANPTCSVTGTDLSPTAVAMFKQAAVKAGIAADRFNGWAADSTLLGDGSSVESTDSAKAHAVLLIFTLAAVHPLEMPAMLQTAFQALQHGGLLLIRDHGLYDLTHLRLPPEQQLADKLYRRLDGTTCYFFTTEDLQAKAEAVGFVTKECKYACTKLFNRKKQLNMKRVFVHGVFQKPF